MTDFILVHGGAHDAWCWNFVSAELEARGHRVFAPDLPIENPDNGAAAYANFVVEYAADASEDAVVVGHSVAGLTIPLIATLRPVGALVFLCASVPEIGRSWSERRPGREWPVDACGRISFDRAAAMQFFYHDCPRAIAEDAIGHLRPQAVRAIQEKTPLTTWPAVAMRLINATEDRVVSVADGESDAARINAPLTLIPGGHSPFLARPTMLVDVLLKDDRVVRVPSTPR